MTDTPTGLPGSPGSLPEWLVAELPTAKPYGRVEPDGPTAVVHLPPDGPPTRYESVPAAYEALQDVDLEFSESLLGREDAFEDMITFPAQGNGSRGDHAVWLASNNARHWRRLVDAYRTSLAVAEAYHSAANSGASDFVTAYGYLNRHPAFWIRSTRDSDSGHWSWRTSGHMNRVDLEVWQADDGGVRVGLETGAHTPEMTEHFHDPYLDAVAETFEAAVLQLARNVAVSFHDDGTDTGVRPDNPDADELVRTIRERTGRTDQADE